MCFEPDPGNFALLTRNVEANGLVGVELPQAAVSDSEDPLTFFTSQHGSPLRNSTIRARVQSPEQIEVRAVRLSTFLRWDADLLKLDVEGAEGRVLADLIASGALARVKRLRLPDPRRPAQMAGAARLPGHLDLRVSVTLATVRRAHFTGQRADSVRAVRRYRSLVATTSG